MNKFCSFWRNMYNSLKITVSLPHIEGVRRPEWTEQTLHIFSDHHMDGCFKQMGEVSLECYLSGSVLLENQPVCLVKFRHHEYLVTF